MTEEIPKGMYVDGAGITRCAKCGWPRNEMVNDVHQPCMDMTGFPDRRADIAPRLSRPPLQCRHEWAYYKRIKDEDGSLLTIYECRRCHLEATGERYK